MKNKNKNKNRCFDNNTDLFYLVDSEGNIEKKFLKLSKNEQISFLCDELEREAEKPLEEIDFEKMNFYTEILGVISESPEGISNDEGLDTLFCRITEERKKKNISSATKTTGSVIKLKAWKRIAVIAATLVLLLCTATVVGAINGVNVFKELYNFGLGIFDLEKGEEYDVGDITFIRNGNVKEYKTLNEFFVGENITGVYYPENVHNISKLMNVSIKETKENTKICFSFENNNFVIFVDSTDVYGFGTMKGTETYTATNGIVSVYFYDGEKYQFMFHLEEWYYSITTTNYDQAISCIESMKEIK